MDVFLESFGRQARTRTHNVQRMRKESQECRMLRVADITSDLFVKDGIRVPSTVVKELHHAGVDLHCPGVVCSNIEIRKQRFLVSIR